MSNTGKVSAFLAAAALMLGLVALGATPASADPYWYYSGPYATQQDCDSAAILLHSPDDGIYAEWPCTYASYYGPGWYFYYRVYDPYCRRCTIPAPLELHANRR